MAWLFTTSKSILGISFAHAMSPVIDELYGDSKEERMLP